MGIVNTASKRESVMESRKAKHLAICTDPLQYSVEGDANYFSGIHLVHHPLPELDASAVSTSLEFLDHAIDMPVFISCMTGGSEGGFEANKNLARAAQQLKIPVGLGSVRVLFDHPELFEHFHIKPLAPDVPVLANLGAVQIRDRNHGEILSLMQRLEVQALVIHLNPGQELFQPEGDTDFRGLKDALSRLCDTSEIPIIVKETGFGIPLPLVKELLDMGVAFVDLAGAGGTNWISVEAYRMPEASRAPAWEFKNWGLPTAYLVAMLAETELRTSGKVLASGGLRTGMDIAKALVLGAEMAGMALPIIRTEQQMGVEGVMRFMSDMKTTLRSAMVLCGAPNLPTLRRAAYWVDGSFALSLKSFSASMESMRDSG
jgi:isopentenyl-diphosphate delta-isomerase type 2